MERDRIQQYASRGILVLNTLLAGAGIGGCNQSSSNTIEPEPLVITVEATEIQSEYPIINVDNPLHF